MFPNRNVDQPRDEALVLEPNAAARGALIEGLESLGLAAFECRDTAQCSERLRREGADSAHPPATVLLVASLSEAVDGCPALLDLTDNGVFAPPIVLTVAPGVDSLGARVIGRSVWGLLAKPIAPHDARRLLAAGVEEGRRRQADRVAVNDFRQREQRLSYDERQVLAAVCDGKLNKQIARELGVSVRTVEQRRRRVFSKMNVPSAVPLARRLATVRTLERVHAPRMFAGSPGGVAGPAAIV